MAMGKIVIPTKFNKTGRRVLTTPLQEKQVCAPANQRYRQSYDAIEAEFIRNKDRPLQAYIEEMSHFIASYIASNSASNEDRYRITKFLAESSLRQTGPLAIVRRQDSERWSRQLGDIPGLSQVEEEAWQTYVDASNKLEKEREEALNRTGSERDAMKRALWREISDHIHHQCHPEDDEPNF
jgi:hypothetical protein